MTHILDKQIQEKHQIEHDKAFLLNQKEFGINKQLVTEINREVDQHEKQPLLL